MGYRLTLSLLQLLLLLLGGFVQDAIASSFNTQGVLKVVLLHT